MNLRVLPCRGLTGTCKVPGDKSISHRAAIIGALAEGTTEIDNYLFGADCLSTLRCLESLGVQVTCTENGVRVKGCGLKGLKEPEDILDAGNSGTTMRLLLGALSGQDFFAVLTGDRSLRGRPMGRVVKPLVMMGAEIHGRAGDTRAPLAVKGCSSLKPIAYNLPVASAQVKSAILLAGLNAPGTTCVIQPQKSRDHTERMLKSFGALIEVDGLAVRLQGGQPLQGRRIRVPGDISAAAFVIVAASILPDCEVVIEDVGINPTRIGILEVMERMGAQIEVTNRRDWNGEPVADLRVRSHGLCGTIIEGALLPRVIDEIPVLAVAAAAAEGKTEIRNAEELRFKETDRLQAIARELGKMGACLEERPDGLVIEGKGALKGARVHSWGDHRIAMALAVAGLLAGGETTIEDCDCVDVSFPGFAALLRSLGAVVETES
jgi:3-phosphoshikimate 1-carboxyvinyltransferase